MHLQNRLAMSLFVFLIGCKIEVESGYEVNQEPEALAKQKTGYVGFSSEDEQFVERVQKGIEREGIDHYIRQFDEGKVIFYPEAYRNEVQAIISHASHSLAPSPYI